jgi:site-specific DNA recombinase
MVLDQARSQSTEESASLVRDVQVVQRHVSKIHTEIRKLATEAGVNAHAATRLADLHEQVNTEEQRLSELRCQLERVQAMQVTKNEVDAALESFTPLWETLSPREQARVLRLLVQRVEYDGVNGKVSIRFHANGIKSLTQGDTVRPAVNDRALAG